MNTLLCALPFGLNISVSNVTNPIFVSCYVQPLCMLLEDLLYMNSRRCRCAQLQNMDKLYRLSLKLFFFRYASFFPNMIDEKLSRLYPECCMNLSQNLFRVGHEMFGLLIYE